MTEIIGKLKSDRLWAVVAYTVLLVVNVKTPLGIPDEQMTELMWVVMAFIGSKMIRGTTAGNMLVDLVPQVRALFTEREAAEAIVVEDTNEEDPVERAT